MSSPFFSTSFFLSGIGSEIQMIRMCILVNLGRVYTERTINDVKRKDPMEKSKEPTLKQRQCGVYQLLSRDLSLCNDVTGQDPWKDQCSRPHRECPLRTSPRFLAIFYLPTYLVLLYNVPFLGLSWTPLPTLIWDVINERSLTWIRLTEYL